MSKQTRYSRLFWGIILLGLVVPLVVKLFVRIMFTNDDLTDILISFITFENGMAVVALMNVIPYIVLAKFAKSRLLNLTTQNKYYYVAEIIGAGVPHVFFNLHSHIVVWRSIYSGLRISSTASVAFAFIPIYGFIIMFIGGAIGSLVGRLVSVIKKS